MIQNLPKEKIFNLLISTFYDKHFSLWPDLKSSASKFLLKTEIDELLLQKDIDINCNNAYLIYEYLEYHNRQIKNVVKFLSNTYLNRILK